MLGQSAMVGSHTFSTLNTVRQRLTLINSATRVTLIASIRAMIGSRKSISFRIGVRVGVPCSSELGGNTCTYPRCPGMLLTPRSV